MNFINQGGGMSDEGYRKYAVEFLMLNSRYYDHEYPINVDSAALKFIKSTNYFREKDIVSAEILTDTLVELGYLKELEKENNTRRHCLTEKGKDFVSKANQNSRR